MYVRAHELKPGGEERKISITTVMYHPSHAMVFLGITDMSNDLLYTFDPRSGAFRSCDFRRIADKFDVTWWGTVPGARETNPFALDLATNLLLYSLDRDLISDIHARREARRLLSTFQSRKILILSVLDWAEKFGASILDLTDRLGELEEAAEAAVDDYLDQDYASTIQFMESMLSEATEMTAAALQRKDEALYWVYISEWLSVTSAGVLAGVMVWSLMVRRRKFREVGRTRLRTY